jgi:uncharacterized protein (TIGR01777 family)
MDVAITGSTGLIGTALAAELRRLGHRVRRVVRGGPGAAEPGTVVWDLEAGTIDAAALEGVDAVVHLAGEGIAERRWTVAQKERILRSRVDGTTLIARTVAGLDPRPTVLVCASGISVYGDQGDRVLTEADPPAEGFLPDVVVAWEAAAAPAAAAGIRTVHLRSGIVLDGEGGALAKQLPLFKLGLGGRFGDGRQWLPWISLPDEVGAIVHLLGSEVAGPVNLCSPEPVTNAEFTETLARVLSRPSLIPIPKLGPTIVLGRELTETLLYWSTRAVPAVLEADGYRFRHPRLEAALRDLLRRPAA